MTFEPDMPPDLDGPGVWDAADEVIADRVAAAFGAPDTIDCLREVSDMMTMQAAERLVWIDRVRRGAILDAAPHGGALSDVVDRSVRLEIAAALRITEHAAAGLMAQGEALVHRYPSVLESFRSARMTERHAQILVGAVEAVEPEFVPQILPLAIELAEAEPVGTFRRRLQALIDTVRAVTLEERHREAVKTRRVVVESGADAMMWVRTFLPAVEGHAIFGRATRIAKTIRMQEGETRTLDQLRADVLCDLLIEGDTDLHPAAARGIRASVVVTVPALTLLQENLTPGDEPPTVEGVGPIPLSRARELCGGGEGWMRVLTHPETGMVLSVGRDQYRPPPGLRRLVKWRAERCMGPGCGMPASRCHIDHRRAWEDGGETRLENLNPFCENHHIVKHHGDWEVRDVEGSYGAVEWISPTGRHYTVQPERSVPVFTPTNQGVAPF